MVKTDYADYTDFQNYIKNNFIIDYADYTDFQNYIKNNFIIDYADSTDCQDHLKIVLSLATLATLIFNST